MQSSAIQASADSPGGNALAGDPLLTLQNCSLTLNDTHILRNIDLDIRKGEFVSIIGPSGCGKSTTLRLMLELLKPDADDRSGAGKVIFPEVRPRRGMAFQKPVLMPWLTIRGNVELSLSLGPQKTPQSLRRGKAEAALELVGLLSYANYYPKQLSGGMQQRVALARTLAAEPELLLMDEPFGALDEMTRNTLNLELLRLWENRANGLKSIVMVTHSLHEAVSLSDRVVVLSSRPAGISTIIDVPLPKPRSAGFVSVEETEAYQQTIARLRRELQRDD
ncbi:ABC transporter ATP-binding protein [Marinobacter sp. ANT_B65]|uniref:ABC transporter ATP-binding protein n=1 Tax=Marinobacter sp. ANT_B65 TaxID=2039467 RepID=UPI000BBE11B8|nr:ABC transporter ATP-binding protein [Marinobacter sp. ANT_B65]PCM43251.1 ABC transporter ATP-binding protein [Marinobacter sp. ANT_B65]